MIFITGATGFVGSHLTRFLVSKGQNVRLLTRNKDKIHQLKHSFSYYNETFEQYEHLINFVYGDVSDVQCLDEYIDNTIDYVFHCAGLVSFARVDKKKLYEINHVGTANVVNAALGKNVKKLIYVSSIAALGDSQEEFVTESNQKFEHEKSNYYGNSKHWGELEVRRGSVEGLNAIIINPSVIIGPGDWNNGSPNIFKTIYKGLPFYTTGITGYTDVRDLVEIMTDLAFSEIINENFIVSNENLDYKTFFQDVATRLNTKPPKRKIHPSFLLFIGKLFDWFSFISQRPLTISSAMAKAAFSITKYDNSKVRSVLKHNFRPIKKGILFTSKCFEDDLVKDQKK